MTNTCTAGNERRVTSRRLCGFIIVAQIPFISQPFHHLLHLVIPIGPKDHQATDDAARGQRDREADPETREPHVLLKGEIDTHRETNNVIRADSKRCLAVSVLESGFGVDSHKIKNGTGPLSSLST